MMPSRGMGAIASSKQPKTRFIKKRDGDEPVAILKGGGKVRKMAGGGDTEDASLNVSPTYLYIDKDKGAAGVGTNVRGKVPVGENTRLSMDANPSISYAGGKTSTSAGKRRYAAEHDIDRDRSVGAEFIKGPKVMGSFGGAPFSGGVAPDRYVGLTYKQRFAKGGKSRSGKGKRNG